MERTESTIIFENHLDKTEALLRQENLRNAEGELDTEVKKWLNVSSLNALRTLDGEGKGNLIRFLSEDNLLNTNQKVISLGGADLCEIDLEDAWLPNINLQDTYVFDGNLVNTDLTQANLRRAVLNNALLNNAQYDADTLFPAGFDPIQSGLKMGE